MQAQAYKYLFCWNNVLLVKVKLHTYKAGMHPLGPAPTNKLPNTQNALTPEIQQLIIDMARDTKKIHQLLM